MKKLTLFLTCCLLAAMGFAQTNDMVRYLQIEEPGKITRIFTNDSTAFAIKTVMIENEWKIALFDGEELIEVWDASTKFYPKFDNPEEISVKGLAKISENENYEMGSNVIFAKEDINSKIVSITDSILTIKKDDIFENLQVGDVLYSLPTENFPYGYAYKILQIDTLIVRSDDEDELVCKIDPATMEEVFPDGYMCKGQEYMITPSAVDSTVFYDIDEQIATGNLENLLDVNMLDFLSDFTITFKQKMDGWTKYQRDTTLNFLSWKRASIEIKDEEIVISYIIFDLDENFSTTYDQIVAKLTIEHDLSNTDVTFEPSLLNFGIKGRHTWGVSASLNWEFKEDWEAQDMRKAKYYLQEKALGKKFCIASIPLTPASATDLLVHPSLDIFFELKLDMEGNFYVEAGLKDFTYQFNFSTQGNNYFTTTQKPTGYVDIQLNAKATLRASIGGGLTFEIPAFRLFDKGNKKSYAGIYFDYGADLGIKLGAGINVEWWDHPSEFEGLCFEAELSLSAYPEFYGEYDIHASRFFQYYNKILILGKEDFGSPVTIEGKIGKKWCTEEATTVVSFPAWNITDTTATLSGEITQEVQSMFGNDDMIDKGFFYSTDIFDLVNEGENTHKVSFGGGLSSFFAEIDSLQPNTMYFFVAYVDWIVGREYSQLRWFTTTNGEEEPNEEGVLINGIVWATKNLDVGGVFCEYPEDYGALYQWGRRTDGHESRTSPCWPLTPACGNSASGVVSSLDGNGQIPCPDAPCGYFIRQNSSPYDWRTPQNNALWNSGTETAPIKTVNDPCPAGWRVPTQTELNTLTNTTYVNRLWIQENGINGYRLTDIATGNTLFLPAAGDRYCLSGSLYLVGTYGYYLSSTPYSTYAYYLYFDSGYFYTGYNSRANGRSIRCISEQ
ncbi:MAG: fibrobacter succinogenes major paralogous domain-containing protein [Lentimicrobiaceae bacterium]|nr:fibrobacter succinogenes major paralogous domain-containing protein [Lentimicrobiaceae bacterium]